MERSLGLDRELADEQASMDREIADEDAALDERLSDEQIKVRRQLSAENRAHLASLWENRERNADRRHYELIRVLEKIAENIQNIANAIR